MKKYLITAGILIVCISLFIAPINVFGASTSKALSTNFTLVNLGASEAFVNIQYLKDMDNSGAAWTGSTVNSVTLSPNGGQAIVRQYTDLLTPGRGSVILTSDQPLGAVVQILTRGQTPTYGAYSGFQQGSNISYIPLVTRRLTGASGLTNTQIVLQNTGQTDATVSVNFLASGSVLPASYSKSGIVIKPGVSYYYDIEEETNLGIGWYGSAEVNAGTGTVAVIINIFSGANGLQTFSGFPAESAGTGWAIPLFASRLGSFNLNTPISIQNVSGTTIPVDGITLTCKGSVSYGSVDFTKTNKTAVPNNGGFAFNPVVDSTLPTDWQGSCIVNSTQNIVTYVQMRKPGSSDETAAFEAFRTTSTDTVVFVPWAAKRLPTASTAITIQNLGATNAQVRLTYTRSPECTVGNASYEFLETIPANGGQLIQNLRLTTTQPTIPAGWYGTLKVEDNPNEATPAQPIVAFVQITDIQGTLGDTLMAYDAFTLP